MRVLESGIVRPRDSWDLQERPNPDGSIPAINRCMYLHFDPSYASRITQMQGLGTWWKEQLIEKQDASGVHWTDKMKD